MKYLTHFDLAHVSVNNFYLEHSGGSGMQPLAFFVVTAAIYPQPLYFLTLNHDRIRTLLW